MSVDPRHAEHRRRWQDKPVLRTVYEDYYRRIRAACGAGPTLEIGGGPGNLKASQADTVSTDILLAPWLDAVCDAEQLPFRNGSFGNIVMLDVLHHIPRPIRFLAEGIRVLRPRGRVILVEPAITPGSYLFYKHFHPEAVDMRADPLTENPDVSSRDPFDANQAIPSLLLGRYRRSLRVMFPRLRIVEVRHLSLLCYPLSGGFRRWSLIPARAAPACLRFESKLERTLGPMLGFRIFAVLERGA